MEKRGAGPSVYAFAVTNSADMVSLSARKMESQYSTYHNCEGENENDYQLLGDQVFIPEIRSPTCLTTLGRFSTFDEWEAGNPSTQNFNSLIRTRNPAVHISGCWFLCDL